MPYLFDAMIDLYGRTTYLVYTSYDAAKFSVKMKPSDF